ncbi:MAG: NBR1-Ig-like domain-containing protein [Anaerolineales bacterium]|jgi:hypothetical protein
MVKKLIPAGIVLMLLVLAGCNLPNRVNPEEVGPGALTLAVQTVQAQLTLDAINVDDTQEPPGGDQPTITLAPSVTPEPSATPDDVICDGATFITDVTVPDGEEMLPGEAFTKTWRLKNVGECKWTEDYELVFDQGVSMGGPASVPVTKGEVEPGDQVDVSVDLVAPGDDGVYKGFWQMRNDQDEIFTVGGFWVEIEVIEVVTYTSKNSFQVAQAFEADLDNGSSPPDGLEDFFFNVPAPADKRIEPRNGALFLLMGEDRPEYGTCLQAALDDEYIEVDEDLVGQYVCYKTDEGRYGRFEVISLIPEDITQIQTLTLRYVTWIDPD